jgi:hypothetical protein
VKSSSALSDDSLLIQDPDPFSGVMVHLCPPTLSDAAVKRFPVEDVLLLFVRLVSVS